MLSPRSMSMPPEASAPVLIVSRPRRIGSACARKIEGKPSAEAPAAARSEEHTSELQSHSDLVCRLLLEKKKKKTETTTITPAEHQNTPNNRDDKPRRA